MAILLSIAVSQILLALGLGFLLLSDLPLRWPRAAAPFALFIAWTFVSLAFSPDPARGLIQVRKMFVYLMLLVAFSALRRISQVKWVALGWMIIGTLTAGRGLFQFWKDVLGARAEHREFYTYYIADRIRGFMSHWMTFSGQDMFILVFVVAFLLFAPDVRRRLWLAIPCAIAAGLALVLSDTRSVWIASVAAIFYLLWSWNKRAALAMPVLLVIGLIAAPGPIQQRVISIVRWKNQTDSNEHRIVCWRTGWQMIKAHPIVGVGPEEVSDARVFNSYVPADIPRPLPDGWYGHLHDVYIQYAAERGVPAGLLIIAALVLPLADFARALHRTRRGRSDTRFLLHAGIAAIIGAAVSGIMEHNLGDTEVLTMFLVILCAGYVAAETKPAAVKESAPVAA
jgi:putative inorganic carbon (hco3(-)) transporter